MDFFPRGTFFAGIKNIKYFVKTLNMNLVYSGKTKDVFALEDGNYLLKLKMTVPEQTVCSTRE